MKTIYLNQDIWTEAGGERLGRAVGETAGLSLPETRTRLAGEDKVIDLAAWKAENLVEPEPELAEEPESALGQYQGRELVRRPRRRHQDALIRGELAATLSVVCVTAALMLRVLVF